jgi:hypothetical protein
MFYSVLYVLIYISIIVGTYFILKKKVIKQAGVEYFTGPILFSVILASIMMPNVLIAIIQLIMSGVLLLMV